MYSVDTEENNENKFQIKENIYSFKIIKKEFYLSIIKKIILNSLKFEIKENIYSSKIIK